jgi:hypothetical protein
MYKNNTITKVNQWNHTQLLILNFVYTMNDIQLKTSCSGIVKGDLEAYMQLKTITSPPHLLGVLSKLVPRLLVQSQEVIILVYV